jgi:hypothetical protein
MHALGQDRRLLTGVVEQPHARHRDAGHTTRSHAGSAARLIRWPGTRACPIHRALSGIRTWGSPAPTGASIPKPSADTTAAGLVRVRPGGARHVLIFAMSARPVLIRRRHVDLVRVTAAGCQN